jgi:hypothetical protein
MKNISGYKRISESAKAMKKLNIAILHGSLNEGIPEFVIEEDCWLVAELITKNINALNCLKENGIPYTVMLVHNENLDALNENGDVKDSGSFGYNVMIETSLEGSKLFRIAGGSVLS